MGKVVTLSPSTSLRINEAKGLIPTNPVNRVRCVAAETEGAGRLQSNRMQAATAQQGGRCLLRFR